MSGPAPEPNEEIPEWIVLSGEIRALAQKLRADTSAAAGRFHRFDDVRDAIAYRAHVVPRLQARVGEINKLVAYLNLIAPSMRFHLAPFDTDEEVRPIAKAYFRSRCREAPS